MLGSLRFHVVSQNRFPQRQCYEIRCHQSKEAFRLPGFARFENQNQGHHKERWLFKDMGTTMSAVTGIIESMAFTTLSNVPVILVAGEDDDLCVRDKQLAIEMLCEQAEEGMTVYALYVRCGGGEEHLTCVITEDFDTEAIHKASIVANKVGEQRAQRTGDIMIMSWNLSALSEDGYIPIHEESCFIMPEICYN